MSTVEQIVANWVKKRRPTLEIQKDLVRKKVWFAITLLVIATGGFGLIVDLMTPILTFNGWERAIFFCMTAFGVFSAKEVDREINRLWVEFHSRSTVLVAHNYKDHPYYPFWVLEDLNLFSKKRFWQNARNLKDLEEFQNQVHRSFIFVWEDEKEKVLSKAKSELLNQLSLSVRLLEMLVDREETVRKMRERIVEDLNRRGVSTTITL